MLLGHHPRFVEGTTSPSVHGTTGARNTRTLKAEKLQQLTHKMAGTDGTSLDSEMTWENFGETTTEEGHRFFFSGKTDKNEHVIGFLVHKDIMNTVMGCRPVSSRLITIRLRVVPSITTVVQRYAPTLDYDDNEVGELYDQQQNVIDQILKKDIFVVQED